MGARTGKEYVERIAQTRPTIEINGERVAGPVTEQEALVGIVRSYVGPYDLQHDPQLRDVLTYELPSSGERVGTSFLVPRHPLGVGLSVSSFAGRQTLYEYFFFGDPVRMAGAFLKATDREPDKARVRSFLDRVTEGEPVAV